ncbi:MAG TPA: high frequency lysogenization protein HflD [Acidiferrobacterales bacterium]|nr:high frequency lysogenization protein HflD [Acidiferrobacterales bacterium]
MARSLRNPVLALAGIFQSARLVQQLAREGRTDHDALRASIQSILALDAPDVETVYGGARGVRLGLELLSTRLSGKTQPSDMEMARYVVALVQLEGNLRRRPAMLDAIRQGIDTARAQMKFFQNDAPLEDVHPLLMDKLAELYSQTISTLTPRIMVSGEHGHLNNPAIAAKVRAALLAGIRSAVLWRQLGGRRWQLLFTRGKIARSAAELLV